MGRKRSFLGFLATFVTLFWAANLFAARYSCPEPNLEGLTSMRQYTSCVAGRYLTAEAAGNTCAECSSAKNTTSTRSLTESCSKSCSIANGTCTYSNCTQSYTETCSGYYTGGGGGTTVGSSKCTGCSAYSRTSTGTCGGCTISITCNTGYTQSGNTCVPKKYSCGEGEYLNGTTCKTCEPGNYCLGGEWDYNGGIQGLDPCPDDFPKSDVGSTSDKRCYKDCSKPCTQQPFPEGVYTATHGSGSRSGRHYNGGTCNALALLCPITVNSCMGGYYKKGNECLLCSSLGDKTYTSSATGNDSGESACFKSCFAYQSGGYRYTPTAATAYYNDKCQYTPDCITPCTSVANTSSTQSCSRPCSIANGTCSYSGSTQTCNGKYTSTGCSSAGATCSGCSSWGTCSGGTISITCNLGYHLSNGACVNNGYTVVYNANGGSGTMSNSSHTYDVEKALTANAFTRIGHTFSGWATSATGPVAYLDKASVKNLTPENNGTVTLYAVWTPNSYSCGGGKYLNGTTCSPCEPGYYCKGGSWTYNGGIQGRNSCSTDTNAEYPNSNSGAAAITSCYKSCSAYNSGGYRYTPKATTVYYNNSCEYTPACITPCTSVSNTSSTQSCSRACSIANGTCSYSGSTQTCNGKYTSTGCSSAGATCSGCSSWGTCSGGTISITCNLGYHLSNGACVNNGYTVVYNANGGSGTMSNSSHTYDVEKALTANAFTRSGYTFSGWATSATGSVAYADKASVKNLTSKNGDTVNLYAVWKSGDAKNITYNTNGGKIEDTAYTTACNVETPTFNLPTNVTRAGYTFNGWKNTAGNVVTSVAAGTCTSALTFDAQWKACNLITAGACNCSSTQYPVNGICTSCSKSCSDVVGFTSGSYDVCKGETSSICYRNCTTADVPGSASVSGTVTKGGTKTCVATKCSGTYYLENGTCKSCPTNGICDGTGTWSCKTGYEKSGSGCKAKTYPVTLDADGGKFGSNATTTVTATYNQNLPSISKPTRTNYNFLGIYSQKNGGGVQYYNASGTPVKTWTTDSGATLYAHWALGIYTCTAGKASDGTACSSGYYCPGENVNAGTETGENGCERPCPTASGKTVSSPAGSVAIAACQATGNVDIFESTGKTKTGTGAETCNWNGTNAYNVDCNTVPTACNAGYWRPADNSPFCIPVDYGYYRGANEGVRVHNECSKLSGADDTVTTATTTSAAATECYNTCSDKATVNGTLIAVNKTEMYNGTNIPACSYKTVCKNDGYKANGDKCEPKVFTVTLDHNGGTSSTSKIYLKYATGWYSDESATKSITSVEKPIYIGQTFSGYRYGDTVIIDENAKLVNNTQPFMSNVTIEAAWGENPTISCLPGTYYPGTGTACKYCEAGYYCTGISAITDNQKVQGRESCTSLNGTYTAAKDASGKALTVTISSAANAKTAENCYATNVDYQPNQYTTGSQTCYYDEGTKSYNSMCISKIVITCAGGYATANTSATECTPVGYGYYSPDKVLTSTQCPVNSDTGNVGTTQTTTSVAAQDCILDNLWYENDTSGQRRQCFYSNDSKKYDRNCPQSTIVACIAGYWYDASQSKTDCVPVGNGYYSPAQSECVGEMLQPSAAGCSTKRTSCPNGTLTGKDTAASILECEGACPANSYCIDGVEYSCPPEYPYSQVGSDEIGDCYANCSKYKTCNSLSIKDYINPILCTDEQGVNANSCAYKSDQLTSLVQYYGQTDCVIAPYVELSAVCPFSLVTCKAGYYYDGTLENGRCKKCNFEDQYGKYGLSNMKAKGYKPDSTSGSKACYLEADLPCTPPVCPLAEEGKCSDYKADAFEPFGGYRYYGIEEVLPGISDNFVCPGSDWTCYSGYDKNPDADIDPTDGSASEPGELCTPHVYTIGMDNDGADGKDVAAYNIYQKYNDGFYFDEAATREVSKVEVPEKDGWTFNGYYTQPNAMQGTYYQIFRPDGSFNIGVVPDYTEDMMLYAWWTQDVEQCNPGKYYEAGVEKACVAPYYCSGEGTVPVGETGCRSTCPESGWTTENGKTDVTACHKTFNEGDDKDKVFDNGLATWDCTWLGTVDSGSYASCNINIAECDAGYYNPANEKVCKVVESGYYSPAKVLNQTSCPTKTNYTVASDGSRSSAANCYVSCNSYVPTVANSVSVFVTPGEEYSKSYYSTVAAGYSACQYTVQCKVGYTAISGTAPQCKANEYTITLDKNGGAGNVADSVLCTFGSGSCALPATSVLTKAGYKTVNKWCTNADGTGVCFEAGKSATTDVSSTGTNTKLFAIWTPAVFKITLSAADAETNANQGPVYLKYATGWYSDSEATKPLEGLGTNLPTKGDGAYVFAGYKIGDVTIIGANGLMQVNDEVLTVTTQDTTASVVWSKGLTQCAAGYYYPGTGSQCAVCKANHYCPAGKYPTDGGEGGLNKCPNEGLSAGGVSATNIGVCYKEKMAYTTYLDSENTQPKAVGTWTCNYDVVGYTNCDKNSVEIAWCAGGYWYNEGKNAIDCVVAGVNNFSPVGELVAYVCPDNGNTNGIETSDEVGDCMKRMNSYVSDTGNAKGSYVCSARLNGNEVTYDQNCQSDTIEIAWCAGGYWYDSSISVVDCVVVGNDRYSPEGELVRHDCPHGGTTKSTTAATAHGVCQKTMVYPGVDYTGPAVNGSGIRGCFYDSTSDGKLFGEEKSDGYLLNCGDITMTRCNSGYYWASRTDTVCKVVDFGFYGPVADDNNSGNMTGRAACPDSGKTPTDKSSTIDVCYLEKVACDVENGTGENTCNYDNSVQKYSANCTQCVVTGCDTGFSEVDGMCVNCPEDHVCESGAQKTCAEATGGTHTKSDPGTTDVAYCYRDCDIVGNAAQMSGHDYFGSDIADTCKVAVCGAGYTMQDGDCVECPEGYVCDPTDPDNPNGPGAPKSCAVLTGGTHTMSDAGAKTVNDCYQQCEPYEVINGTAVPVEEKAFYPSDCEYKGKSETGNPCDIIDGVCVETECNYNFEFIGGVCKPCARENAITYKQNGNCVVESCASGFHPNGQACEADVAGCEAPNAVAATQAWIPSKNAFGECIITKCAGGYHLSENTCQADEQVCELEHGVGVREWNHNTNTWGECVATECDPGYTNDRSQTNELWKQCGRCNNMYSADGDLAVSSYVQECEIAACMYQGEKYILENNECRLICSTDSDETGKRYWDNKNKKCVHDCFEEKGYVPW